MLMFGVYLLIGMATLYVEAVMHLVMAEKQGYEAIKFWSENGSVILESDSNLPANFLIGIIIWPVRAIQFAMGVQQYYELYDLKED